MEVQDIVENVKKDGIQIQIINENVFHVVQYQIVWIVIQKKKNV